MSIYFVQNLISLSIEVLSSCILPIGSGGGDECRDSCEFATCFMHPSTYLNKIILPTSKGQLYLWNVHSGKVIHKYSCLDPLLKDVSIACATQTPALDVIAIGSSNGIVALVNLQSDSLLFKLYQQEGPARGISFRTDDHVSSGMVSTNDQGDLYIWNLEEQKLVDKIPMAHENRISSLHFLPGKPVLLSSSSDNSLKASSCTHICAIKLCHVHIAGYDCRAFSIYLF